MKTPSPYGRPIIYGAADWCDHPLRILGAYFFRDGSRHVADFCCQCAGRTECISRRDLEAADIDPDTVVPFRDNRERAA